MRAVHSRSDLIVRALLWYSVLVHAVNDLQILFDVMVGGVDSHSLPEQAVSDAHHLSNLVLGSRISNWFAVHVVSSEHSRSEVGDCSMDWNSSLPQIVRGLHCLFEVPVGATDSKCVKVLQ